MEVSAEGSAGRFPYDEMQQALTEAKENCNRLYDECRNLYGQFVNELSELSRYKTAKARLEQELRAQQQQALQNHIVADNQVVGHLTNQLQCAHSSVAQMEKRANEAYERLGRLRAELIKKLGESLQTMTALHSELIDRRLHRWKEMQKLAQMGNPFDNKDVEFDDLQQKFAGLANCEWDVRTVTTRLIDLLTRGPQETCTPQLLASLETMVDNLTKLLCVLVSQSFVVSLQPEPVLKTQHKFTAEVRMLIGDTLGVRQQLDNARVTVRIIAEEDAKQLGLGIIQEKDVKAVGAMNNDTEHLKLDNNGHLAAKFDNSKLVRINQRKPPCKGSNGGARTPVISATDQKYALLFHISPFTLGNLGQFDVWTLSLPLMVTVHGSQDCDAQGSILWQRAFGAVNIGDSQNEPPTVTWPRVEWMLKCKFPHFTGAKKPLSQADLDYCRDRLLTAEERGRPENAVITYHRFAKQSLHDDVSFSFWEWFFSIMQLMTKQKLLHFWDQGWLTGFIDKHESSAKMLSAPCPTFMLRFSDSTTGAVSIGFVVSGPGVPAETFHLAPFTAKDLDQLSLTQRILSCTNLEPIQCIYPNIDKNLLVQWSKTEEGSTKNHGGKDDGYIVTDIKIVARTGQDRFSAPSTPFGSASATTSSATPYSAESSSPSAATITWSPGTDDNMETSQPEWRGEDPFSSSSAEIFDISSLLGPDFQTDFDPGPSNNLMAECGEMAQIFNGLISAPTLPGSTPLISYSTQQGSCDLATPGPEKKDATFLR